MRQGFGWIPLEGNHERKRVGFGVHKFAIDLLIHQNRCRASTIIDFAFEKYPEKFRVKDEKSLETIKAEAADALVAAFNYFSFPSPPLGLNRFITKITWQRALEQSSRPKTLPSRQKRILRDLRTTLEKLFIQESDPKIPFTSEFFRTLDPETSNQMAAILKKGQFNEEDEVLISEGLQKFKRTYELVRGDFQVKVAPKLVQCFTFKEAKDIARLLLIESFIAWKVDMRSRGIKLGRVERVRNIRQNNFSFEKLKNYLPYQFCEFVGLTNVTTLRRALEKSRKALNLD